MTYWWGLHGRPPTFNPAALDQVRRDTNLLALIGERIPLRKLGASSIGLCPFHQEKTPSFRVHPTYFKCFGCGRAGDAISFLRAIDGLSFPDAVRVLAERAGVSLDDAPVNRERRAVAAEIAGECAYWVSAGFYAAWLRRKMLPAVEVEAWEWLRGDLGEGL